jgi:hypothetical protein
MSKHLQGFSQYFKEVVASIIDGECESENIPLVKFYKSLSDWNVLVYKYRHDFTDSLVNLNIANGSTTSREDFQEVALAAVQLLTISKSRGIDLKSLLLNSGCVVLPQIEIAFTISKNENH